MVCVCLFVCSNVSACAHFCLLEDDVDDVCVCVYVCACVRACVCECECCSMALVKRNEKKSNKQNTNQTKNNLSDV